jgi:hypothetical protein
MTAYSDSLVHTSILGLGNSADAVEILSIGYILAVYEDKEGALTRAQQGKWFYDRSPVVIFLNWMWFDHFKVCLELLFLREC